jgi:RNA polymerase-binding transcription factor DksA
MANGWARDGAVQDQIGDTVSDAVKLARLRLSVGGGAEFCGDCGDRIPEARRKALPASRTCIGLPVVARSDPASCGNQTSRKQG